MLTIYPVVSAFAAIDALASIRFTALAGLAGIVTQINRTTAIKHPFMLNEETYLQHYTRPRVEINCILITIIIPLERIVCSLDNR